MKKAHPEEELREANNKPVEVVTSSEAYRAIEKRAHEIMEAGEAPTFAQAVDLAIQRDPMLWIRYAQEIA